MVRVTRSESAWEASKMAGKGSDIKPLRQEDYQAMAEELRVLKEKLAKDEKKKAPKPPKPPRQPGSLDRWWSSYGEICLSLLAIATLLFAFGFMIRDCIKEDAKPNCYSASQGSHSRPFDPWHVLKVGTGRYGENYLGWECRNNGNNCPGWKTKGEAEAFMKQWDLKGCSK
jgi:hypothetical protein